MALKDIWTDKVDGKDYVVAKDINDIANSVIGLEEKEVENGATFVPKVSSDGIISWENDKNLENPEPVNIKGQNGEDGADGFSPIVSLEKNGKITTISITDKDGVKTSEIHDGADGEGVGGSGVYDSSFNITDSAWDSTSVTNHSYHFKVLRYPVNQGNLNVDFDVRLLVSGVGFRYPFNLQRPFGDGTRIQLRPPRILFEDESKKNYVTYIKAYERALNDSERELWFEIVTASGYKVNEAYLSVVPNGGEISDVGLVQKPYESYTSPTGFDSASIWSDRWANKTAVINSSSRATAPYATAGGDDCVASGEASDVGGNGNTVSGEASFSRGTGNTNAGKDAVQGGNGNYNEGYSTAQIGHNLKNYGGNAAQFGHTNTNRSNHTLQTGYNNEIPEGCDYAATNGANLKANAKYQGVHGKHNATDTRALELWGYGTADAKKNVFAIPMNGTPEKDYDGITLGYLDTEAFKKKILAALPLYNGEVVEE